MKVTVCDFCRKPTDSIHIPHVGKIVVKSIHDNRWKTDDICITCLFKMIKKEMDKIKRIKKNDCKSLCREPN